MIFPKIDISKKSNQLKNFVILPSKAAMSMFDLMVLYMRQSSAKRRAVDDKFHGRSLIYRRNPRGPMTVPCGIPDVIVDSDEHSPSTSTF